MATAKKGKGTEAQAADAAGKGKIHDKMPAVPTVVVPGKPGDEAAKKTVAKANSVFTLLKEKDATTKMPKQCVQILEILGKAKDKSLTRDKLLEEMTKVVETRQPIERILGFYQSRLVNGNYIKIVPVAAPAKAADKGTTAAAPAK